MRFFFQKQIAILIILCSSFAGVLASNKTSQTFFMSRTISSDSTKELALSNYRLYHNLYPKKVYNRPRHRSMFSTQGTYFYQGSDDARDLARYFLLDNKTELSVKEDGTGDIGSEWIGIFNPATDNTEGTFTIRPEREIYGTILNWHCDFSKRIKGLWGSLLIPVVRVRHNIKISDAMTVEGTEQVASGEVIRTIKEALNQADWRYGRFHPTTLTNCGVDDIQVKFGYNCWMKEYRHVGFYGHILIPMGYRPTGEYVFEPMVGNGGHVGLGLGTNIDYEIGHWGKCYFNVMTDFKWRYLFSSIERRSFDLMNGPWTRYLLLAHSFAPGIPFDGINRLTRDMKVSPRHQIDWWTALHFKRSDFHAEFGYNLWWRDSEGIKLRNAWETDKENLGIADPDGVTSASTAKISNSFIAGVANGVTADAVFTKITASDLDLSSAAHDSALSHKIYGAISLNSRFLCGQPGMLGFGGSYEFADDNTAMNQWAIWFKTSYSY